jgi:hypothetical protein
MPNPSCSSFLRLVLLPLVLCSVATPDLARAGDALSQTVILQPGRPATLRIDFNYNWDKALPPFPKEPPLAGKRHARGLIPTVPPTPLLRNISENALYLTTDHSRDFVNGLVATYHSRYDGHVLFEGIQVRSVRDGLEIPYTLDMYTYEEGCAGWFQVRSGWDGEIELAGERWRLAVVDNLDGVIGQDDVLCLQRMGAGQIGPLVEIKPVPRRLFLGGRTYDLGFRFKDRQPGACLEATLTETNLALAPLALDARGCSYVRLGNDEVTALLDASTVTNLVPAGIYRVEDCLVGPAHGLFRPPAFIRCSQEVRVAVGQTASLRVGLPLRNTVSITRERNMLRLTYQLLGEAGEQYEYYDWRDRPRFSVYKAGVKIGGGNLPFG